MVTKSLGEGHFTTVLQLEYVAYYRWALSNVPCSTELNKASFWESREILFLAFFHIYVISVSLFKKQTKPPKTEKSLPNAHLLEHRGKYSETRAHNAGLCLEQTNIHQIETQALFKVSKKSESEPKRVEESRKRQRERQKQKSRIWKILPASVTDSNAPAQLSQLMETLK